MNVYFDVDGTLAEFKICSSEEDLRQEGYFYNLATLEPVTTVRKFVKDNRTNYYIVTCYLENCPAKRDKQRWVEKEIPGMPEDRILFVPYGSSKGAAAEQAMHRKLTKSDVLIDDHTPNLLAWEEMGGRGVKWLNGINGKKNRFRGPRFSRVEDLEAYLQKVAAEL